eukprot:TRINITY_DN7352_c0_g2_i1.p1 TRINITY_DN7352_c0_g2~~TRINITY_DN7352_c0_g2_i1.p1  ORF type:complete len:128 (+),score=16.10 TRINITY_DN7352_c0_g2_i1:75-458(+)
MTTEQTCKSMNPLLTQKSGYSRVQDSLAGSGSFPAEFVYEHDFDENGVLFYLGTHGKSKDWVNPFTLGQVTVFSSSLGHGSLADITGRAAANCRTLNEPSSFFGLDLGAERVFRPSCYTIRNRCISS